MTIEDKDFIGREFPQNCGDSLLVLERTNEYNPQRNVFFRCQFKKYPYEVLVTKQRVLCGSVVNPQIEQVEFVNKIWPQKCGDSLKIIEKVQLKEGTPYLWRCQFTKYHYEVLVPKRNVQLGSVMNPQIEQVEFLDKIWPQKCGDSLRVIKRSEKRQGNNHFYECEFVKCPYKVLAVKKTIMLGTVYNPLTENFVGQTFPQNCGDSLFVIEKTNEKEGEEWLYKCKFLKYKNEILVRKRRVLQGDVCNYELPPYSKENLIKYIQENFKEKPSLQELADSLKLSVTSVGRWINQHNLQEKISYYQCVEENSLRNWIKTQNNSFLAESKYLKNEGKYYEIDIYSPNLKLGFEFNGNYWHSNLFKENNYHQQKTLIAKKEDINLIHIFEYEWLNRQDVIKSFIKSKLGLFDKKIGASKCKIKELDYKEYAAFCNENHLQGEAGARIKLGLFYKNELIQIMSFGSPRFTSDFDWEIIRECSKLGYIIIGGKEKLWSYFIKNYSPKNCISYCDFSKFTGNSYLKLGFKKERLNKPGFVWYDNLTGEIFWRNPYKNQEMKEKNYLKIYDCGQLVFIWNKN